MNYLFINGSPNKNGNTAQLAKQLLKDKQYETCNLTDYKIYSYGQNMADDQLHEVIDHIENSDVVVLGSPLYWHNICGSIRNMLDRFYGLIDPQHFSGKKLVFIMQGASPEKWMLDASEYTIQRFSKLYGFAYLGMVTKTSDIANVSNRL